MARAVTRLALLAVLTNATEKTCGEELPAEREPAVKGSALLQMQRISHKLNLSDALVDDESEALKAVEKTLGSAVLRRVAAARKWVSEKEAQLRQVATEYVWRPTLHAGGSHLEYEQLSPAAILCTWCIWFVLMSLIAYLYHSTRVSIAVDIAKPGRREDDFKEWQFRLFGCLDEPQTTLCAACFPGILWAETIGRVPGLATFWAAFFLFSLGVVLTQVLAQYDPGPGGLVWLIFVLILVSFRQRLRKRFDMAQGDAASLAEDCIGYLCCLCCALVQDARHVDAAIRSGHRALKEDSGH